jgi:DNA invertase Pin-like site-specific DNA recombinase
MLIGYMRVSTSEQSLNGVASENGLLSTLGDDEAEIH